MGNSAVVTRLGRIMGCVLGLGLCLMGQPVYGQEGAPDPAFPIQVLSSASRDIALQSDGQILLTGYFTANDQVLGVERLSASGSIDTTFNGSDESLVSYPGNLTSANGYTYLISYAFDVDDGPYNGTLQRYQESTGQLDAAFSAVTVPGQSVNGYLVQANGQILVWGDAIYRRNADGSIDSTFKSPALSTGGTISGLSVTAGGLIYVWGNFTTLGGIARNEIARLNSDGSIDPNFVPATSQVGAINQVVQEPSGTLLLNIIPSTIPVPTLIRLKADGTQDSSFQSPVLQASSSSFFETSIANFTETPDQEILLWGNISQINQVSIPGYTKLKLDGTVDMNFVAASSTAFVVGVTNILVQPNGELLLAGALNPPGVGYGVPLVLLNADGSIDSNFNLGPENPVTYSQYYPPSVSGVTSVGGNAPNDPSLLGLYSAGPILVQPDGKILAGLFIPSSSGGVGNGGLGGDGGGVIVVGPGGNSPPPPPPLFLRYLGEGIYPPHRPSTVTVTSPSAHETDITWNSVYGVTGYQIEREQAGQWVVLASVGPTVTSFADLTADGVTNFPYRVEAQNAHGFSSPSPAVAASAPAAFGALSAVAVAPTQVTLSWPASSGEWDYEIYREDGTAANYTFTNGVPSLPLLATVASSATSYVDNTVSTRQTYSYLVLARNVGGPTVAGAGSVILSFENSYLATVTTPSDVPPATPLAFLAGSAASNTIDLVWQPSAWATGYRVERSADGVDGWQVIATLAGSASSYLDTTGLSSDQTYYYRITAYDGVGPSSVSTIISAVAPNANWNPPGTLDRSFAPSPAITNVYSAKISPSGMIGYRYGGNYDDSTYLGI
ncbi:MAG TPA: hypothetical protein VGC39_07165, partial [Candidatus Methylacidiphilales bacterium]